MRSLPTVSTDEAMDPVDPHAYRSGTRGALFELARGTCYFPECQVKTTVFVKPGQPSVNVHIAHIEGARLIPLSQLPDRLNELDGHAEIVTQCHHGSRSLKALEILKGAGFGKVRSLAGGIDAWAEQVEPGMARY